MRFFAPLVAALATLAAAADYTQPDYSKPPSGNAILKPGLNEQVPVGKPYTITWEPTTQGPVSLVLLRGPSTNVVPHETLAVAIPNSGKYVWTPGPELEPDVTHYGLLLVVEGTGQYQWSTQFGISNPGYNSAKPTTAKPTTVAPAPTDAASTEYVTDEVTTTICPETESTSAPAVPTTAAPTTIPVVVPTTTRPAPSTLASSVAVPSTAAPSTSAPANPAFTGAAGRNVMSFGAVAAGVAAVLAF